MKIKVNNTENCTYITIIKDNVTFGLTVPYNLNDADAVNEVLLDNIDVVVDPSDITIVYGNEVPSLGWITTQVNESAWKLPSY